MLETKSQQGVADTRKKRKERKGKERKGKEMKKRREGETLV